MAKTILVTGGAGFIGSNFIRLLLQKTKFNIINLDKLTYSGNLDNLKDIEKNKRYRFVKGDICNKKLVDNIMKKCNLVVNFAAESHVDRSIKDSTEFIRTNIVGTQTLLDAARKYNIERFIQISTDECYGSIDKGYFNEDANLKPNSPYAASKAAADLIARSYFVTHKTPVIIVRSSNNFGPYQYPEKIIPLFVTNALHDKKLPVYADGKNVREWTYVVDNCDAIIFVLNKGKLGEIYNIGSGNELKNIILTKKLLKILNKDEKLIKFVKDRPGHDRRYALDYTKLKKLGWRPKYKLDNALKITALWYKENEKWWGKLKKKEHKFW